ncbi:MAG: radical SAM family heme chaperone HemW [Eggerthellaceae bacterium]
MVVQQDSTMTRDGEGWEPYGALYIHVPFCKKRCRYCDFTTQAIASDSPELDAYTQRLIADIRHYSNADMLGNIKTVYIGGGTPSFLGNKRLSSMLYTLSISMHLTPEVECTLEANPESLTESMVKDVFALGVTRLSMGVQSFNDELLQTLGRIHTARQARDAISLAQKRFTNISIDLMCGLPGQTRAMFESDLRQAIELGVSHISIYPLMIEQGTPFAKLVDAGILEVDEDAAADMMDSAAGELIRAGFHHYEVASYAKPGCESRHNSAYWTGVPYLGLGHGAVSMRQNELERQRFDDAGIIETLDAFQMTAEDLMLGMRMSRGVSDDDVEIASILLPDTATTLQTLLDDGYVVHEDGRWKPTHKGWLFGNHLYGALLDLAP